MKFDKMYDILMWDVGVSQEALDLAFSLMGCNEKTACAILGYYTDWDSFENYLAYLHGEDEDE